MKGRRRFSYSSYAALIHASWPFFRPTISRSTCSPALAPPPPLDRPQSRVGRRSDRPTCGAPDPPAIRSAVATVPRDGGTAGRRADPWPGIPPMEQHVQAG